MVVQILELHGVDFKAKNVVAVDVLEDADVREGVKVWSQWPTVPQLYIHGEFIGGCDILKSLHLGNEIDSLLKNILPSK